MALTICDSLIENEARQTAPSPLARERATHNDQQTLSGEKSLGTTRSLDTTYAMRAR